MEVREASARYLPMETDGCPVGYKQTEVGVIPEDWECLRLGDVIDLLTGFPFPSSGYADSGVLLVRGSNVKRGCMDWDSSITKYWPEITSDVRHYVLKENDLVIAMDGALVGRSYAVITRSDLPSLLLQRVARVRSSEVCQALLAHWIGSESFVAYVDSVKTHTAIPHISPSDIRNFPIRVPASVAEQEAIATALSDADALIESLSQLLAKKRQIKQGAMQELLTGKRRLPGFSGEWESGALGQICDRIVGGGTPSRQVPSYWGGDIPWMTVKDFASFSPRETLEYITRDGLQNSSSSLIPRGTLITSSRMALGKSVIYEVDVAINQDLKALFLKNDINVIFLNYWFQLNEKFIAEMGSGSTVMGISLHDLRRMRFAWPSYDEQTRIASVLSDMDAEIATLEAKLAKARQLKQGMMQALLTGRIRLV